jgi:hypothetical protein
LIDISQQFDFIKTLIEKVFVVCNNLDANLENREFEGKKGGKKDGSGRNTQRRTYHSLCEVVKALDGTTKGC